MRMRMIVVGMIVVMPVIVIVMVVMVASAGFRNAALMSDS